MLLEEVDSCPICGTRSFKQLHICKDFTTSLELFHVKQCVSCDLAITSPRPTVQHAPSYYKSATYISHTTSATGIIDSIYLIIRRFSLQWKYRLVRKYMNGGALLDFGCGTGHFLRYVKRYNAQVFGVEPSAEARRASEIEVADSLNSLPPIQFNVITMWHVLEHVYALEETLHGLKNRLIESGTIFIAVPNWESSDAAHYKELWAAYDVPRHLWHFSKKSMTALLTKSGLQICEIIPMKLDSFYVSMLSEKYKSQGNLGMARFFRGLYVGLRSNQMARKSLNHSSLIYIVKKR